jgi:hypothetical protein
VCERILPRRFLLPQRHSLTVSLHGELVPADVLTVGRAGQLDHVSGRVVGVCTATYR